MSTPPSHAELAQVLAAYGLSGPARPLGGGLINHTFVAHTPSPAAGVPMRAVVQRLHPIFRPEVNCDIEAVTAHVAACGLETPRLMRTIDGARWVELDASVWRALTYVEGTTLQQVADPVSARAAGELVGRFHRALDTLEHEYAVTRIGVHDTDAHVARLRDCLDRWSQGEYGHMGAEIEAAAQQLGQHILVAAEALPALGKLPLRHTHGDLKISNLLFFPGEPRHGRCLVDLDTLGRQTMAYELGDALRSWCNPHGEDYAEARLNEAIFAAAMAGYRTGAGDLLTAAERAAIVPGLQTVCVELAARFCVDIFDDAYFGWDPGRFASRRQHNLIRARGQLSLAASVSAQRRELARHL